MDIKITSKEGVILHTKNKYCKDDIAITLDQSFKQPKGNLEITTNGIEDISDYATVTINVPSIPQGSTIVEDVSSPSTMDAVLIEENLGKVYRYTGETTDKYVNGALYQVTEEV